MSRAPKAYLKFSQFGNNYVVVAIKLFRAEVLDRILHDPQLCVSTEIPS